MDDTEACLLPQSPMAKVICLGLKHMQKPKMHCQVNQLLHESFFNSDGSSVLYTTVINRRGSQKIPGLNQTQPLVSQCSFLQCNPLFHPHFTNYFLPLQLCSSSSPLISPSHLPHSSLSHCRFSNTQILWSPPFHSSLLY